MCRSPITPQDSIGRCAIFSHLMRACFRQIREFNRSNQQSGTLLHLKCKVSRPGGSCIHSAASVANASLKYFPDFYLDASSASSDRNDNEQIVRRHMAITAQRDAKHPSRDANGVGMRSENRSVVDGLRIALALTPVAILKVSHWLVNQVVIRLTKPCRSASPFLVGRWFGVWPCFSGRHPDSCGRILRQLAGRPVHAAHQHSRHRARITARYHSF